MTRLSIRLDRVGVAVAGGLLGLAAAQAAGGSDRFPPIAAAAMATPVTYLPAWAVLAGAVATRRPLLAGLAAATCGAHIALMAPALRPGRGAPPVPAAGADAPTLTVATANGLYDNTAPGRWGPAVLALDADVLAVQELSAHVHRALGSAGVDDRYPHRVVYERERSAGAGLWSRHPLRDVRVVDLGNRDVTNIGIVAVAEVDGHPVTVVNVHTVAPIDRSRRGAWFASFAALRRVLDHVEGPVVLLGDWNATLHHVTLRRFIAEAALRDAHVECRRGHAATWPSPGSGRVAHRLIPMVALIDRVIVGGPVAVRAVSEHTVPGSDHRAVVAVVALGP
ncbi:MAG: endonuclease/exonuclease/phosphatase family protein [Acidimicrobiales bacterium]